MFSISYHVFQGLRYDKDKNSKYQKQLEHQPNMFNLYKIMFVFFTYIVVPDQISPFLGALLTRKSCMKAPIDSEFI